MFSQPSNPNLAFESLDFEGGPNKYKLWFYGFGSDRQDNLCLRIGLPSGATQACVHSTLAIHTGHLQHFCQISRIPLFSAGLWMYSRIFQEPMNSFLSESRTPSFSMAFRRLPVAQKVGSMSPMFRLSKGFVWGTP